MRLLFSLSLVAASALAVASTASATTIDFSTFTGPNNQTLTTYTENGYVVTAGSGAFTKNEIQGNPLNSGSLTSFDDVANSITITQVGGGAFMFNGYDLNDYGSSDKVQIAGSYFGNPVYSSSFTDSAASGWVTSSFGGGSSVTSITFTVENLADFANGATATSEIGIDNLQVAAAPEPSSLMLLGTGLVGVASRLRRKRSA